MSEFEQAVLNMLRHASTFDIQTDNNGQIVIYTGLAENIDGDLVEFNPDAPVGSYRGSEGYAEPELDYPQGVSQITPGVPMSEDERKSFIDSLYH